MKYRFSLVVIILVTFFASINHKSMAQKNKDLETHYAKVDSLLENRLPESAITYFNKNIKGKEGDARDMNIKEAIYEMILLSSKNESDTFLIKSAETNTAKATDPVVKSIWHSITASLYEFYFQDKQWLIAIRTQLANDVNDDFETWSGQQFYTKINDHYRQSIHQVAALRQESLASYQSILTKYVNVEGIFPTLYDFLAWRAAKFYKNDQLNVVNPQQQLELDDKKYFGTANDFVTLPIAGNDIDTLTTIYHSLISYQNRILPLLLTNQPEALLYADLERLAFVHDKSHNPLKDEWYQAALQDLINKYPNTSGIDVAHYEVARMHYDASFEGSVVQLEKVLSPQELFSSLQSIVQRFPKSEGAEKAQSLIGLMMNKNLTATAERVYLPQQNIKIKLDYRNVPTAYINVYRVEHRDLIIDNEDELRKIIRSGKLVQELSVNLLGIDDYKNHTTEIKIDALPRGAYIVVLNDDRSGMTSRPLGITKFQVSELSVIGVNNRGNAHFVAAHRGSGTPISNVNISLRQYNNTGNRSIYPKEVFNYNSDALGNINQKDVTDKIGGRYANYFVLISKNNDTLLTNIYFNDYYNENDPVNNRSVIFTDRSIYRPGQTVYFKGIVFTSSNKNTKNEVVPDRQVTVTLRDVNNEERGTLSLTTNDFGSYQGSFLLPSGLINGNFTISDGIGSQSFSVEEYKRPKFFVEFDTMKSSCQLNDTVLVTGVAKAYAGNAVTNAKVKYRVTRSVHYPHPWLRYYYYFPANTNPREIANGEIVTDEQGKYAVPFALMPDRSIDPKTKPVFTYTVSVDVTDINGETHTQSQSIAAGYDPYIITADVPDNASLNDVKEINIYTRNHNQTPVAVPLKVTVSKLKFPGIFRKRYWEQPDKMLYTLKEFRAIFPYDEYENESNPITWEPLKTTATVAISEANKSITLPRDAFTENGHYLITIESQDTKGNPIVAKYTTHINDVAFTNRPELPLVVNKNKSTVQPSDMIEMRIRSAVDNPYIRHLTNNIFESSVQYAHTDFISRRITESDRGGVYYQFNMIHNNRVYDVTERIDVPWSHKELQIEWATHRNKLLPGSKEEWTMTIKGEKKEQVAAELMSVLYDASLDALKPHSWNDLKNLYPSAYPTAAWSNDASFGTDYFRQWRYFEQRYKNPSFVRVFPDFKGLEYRNQMALLESVVTTSYGGGRRRNGLYRNDVTADAMAAAPAPMATKNITTQDAVASEEKFAPNSEPHSGAGAKDKNKVQAEDKPALADVKARTNFRETAYFIPQLRTNANGDVVIKFEIPEALTEWKMMSVAHTPDLKVGYAEGKVITQKDLMVQPNMSRYFRQNDKVILSTKIANLTDQIMNGKARIEVLDPNTMQSLHLPFKLTQQEQSFAVAARGNGEVSWTLDIPMARYEPVLVRIIAQAGNFSDAEEHLLPVLTNRVLVTETMPLPVRGSGKFDFRFDKLLSANSNTLLHKNFTLEYTPNPAWYAVQALPYLQHYPYECAEQTFNKYYATAIAHKIVMDQPKIQEIYKKWATEDTAALLSNLQKNEELKSALLEQTPWVLEAKNEAEQKRLIAQLFDKRNIEKQFATILKQLEEKQGSDGGWGWFHGMQSSVFITQYIITGLGKLNAVGAVTGHQDRWNAMTDRALNFLDRALVKSYEDLKRYNRDWEKVETVSPYEVNFFYMRSFFPQRKMDFRTQTAYDFYYKIAKKQAIKMKPYQKAQMAIVTHRNKEKDLPATLIQSLRETAMNNAEMGMYWKEIVSSYYWHEAPIEAQALIIEAFSEVVNDEQAVNDQKTWLLKQKQTQNWGTTKATADACYALIMKGDNWLAESPKVTITTGDLVYNLTEANTEAGSGYFKQSIEGLKVTPALGNISVTVQQPPTATQRPSWGAAYWQYFEDMDKVSKSATPLRIEKKLYIKRNTPSGPQLYEVTANDKLRVGDRMTVRITVVVDRDMEYLHLKDMRAAALEPVEVLSGYQYNNGIGYYRSISDAAVNFFFDRVNRGTMVFEYDLFVNARGTYSNGLSTIQCMYAPEFTAHTEGLRLEIE